MEIVQHFLLGFAIGFISIIIPGMLNMTAVKTTIEKGERAGYLFSFGAALTVLAQAAIALVFANFLNKNPHILEYLTRAGIFVFLGLSVVFFYQARKSVNPKGKVNRGSNFVFGIFLSAMNMLAVPFYLAISTYLEAKELLVLLQPFISVFVIGVAFGVLVLFIAYVKMANIILLKARFIARNINYVLSGLFLVLAVLTYFRLE